MSLASDASDKGKGMANCAAIHDHELGRIEMAGRLNGRLRRLHLKDAGNTGEGAAHASPNAMTRLYPTD